MHPKSPKLLADIRASCEFISGVAQGMDLGAYEADALRRAAVERHLEIIGEAMGRLARVDPSTAELIPDHPQIVAFRNLLIHGYDLVDHAQVWNVITHDVPALRDLVGRLLAEAPEE
jgi:uncharacterized protein with HEPN domain